MATAASSSPAGIRSRRTRRGSLTAGSLRAWPTSRRTTRGARCDRCPRRGRTTPPPQSPARCSWCGVGPLVSAGATKASLTNLSCSDGRYQSGEPGRSSVRGNAGRPDAALVPAARPDDAALGACGAEHPGACGGAHAPQGPAETAETGRAASRERRGPNGRQRQRRRQQRGSDCGPTA